MLSYFITHSYIHAFMKFSFVTKFWGKLTVFFVKFFVALSSSCLLNDFLIIIPYFLAMAMMMIHHWALAVL